MRTYLSGSPSELSSSVALLRMPSASSASDAIAITCTAHAVCQQLLIVFSSSKRDTTHLHVHGRSGRADKLDTCTFTHQSVTLTRWQCASYAL